MAAIKKPQRGWGFSVTEAIADVINPLAEYRRDALCDVLSYVQDVR